jgi:hypothetical protein
VLWTFFLPRYDVIRQLLESGLLGDVHTVLADNGELLPGTHRIFRHDLCRRACGCQKLCTPYATC